MSKLSRVTSSVQDVQFNTLTNSKDEKMDLNTTTFSKSKISENSKSNVGFIKTSTYLQQLEQKYDKIDKKQSKNKMLANSSVNSSRFQECQDVQGKNGVNKNTMPEKFKSKPIQPVDLGIQPPIKSLPSAKISKQGSFQPSQIEKKEDIQRPPPIPEIKQSFQPRQSKQYIVGVRQPPILTPIITPKKPEVLEVEIQRPLAIQQSINIESPKATSFQNNNQIQESRVIQGEFHLPENLSLSRGISERGLEQSRQVEKPQYSNPAEDRAQALEQKSKFFSLCGQIRSSLPPGHKGNDVLIARIYQESLQQKIPEAQWGTWIQVRLNSEQ